MVRTKLLCLVSLVLFSTVLASFALVRIYIIVRFSKIRYFLTFFLKNSFLLKYHIFVLTCLKNMNMKTPFFNEVDSKDTKAAVAQAPAGPN
jgi:hypothetical protein